MILFVGRMDQTGFLQEVAEKRGLTYDCTDIRLHISESVMDVLKKPYDTVMYDVGMFLDSAEEIANEIIKINRVNQSRIIIYAPGFYRSAEVISALLKAGIRNFILETGYGAMQTELEKCLAGYYDVNDLDIVADYGKEEEKDRPITDYVTVGVAGAQGRIGTTTQTLQIVKYLTYKGYRACYITVADDSFPEAVYSLYGAAKKMDIGIRYQGIDLYTSDVLSDVLKMDYDFYVFDYGSMERGAFQSVSFLEKNIQVIVAGMKPSELPKTEAVIEKQHYLGARFLFSFVPEGERDDVLDMMADRKNYVGFAGFSPDPFSLTSGNAGCYELIFSDYPAKNEKSRFSFLRRMKKGKEARDKKEW